MAITVASYSTGAYNLANPPTVTITKPSGLAEGDLMIALITTPNNLAATDTPSGWTLLRHNGGANHQTDSFWKIAEASDVAASNFTFVATGGGNSYMGGGLLRITGHVPTSPIDTSAGESSNANDSTPTYTTIDVTPTVTNSLLILWTFLYSHSGAGAASVSGYAIGTSNPSWTEAYDINNTSYTTSAAWAVRPETTATGNPSLTFSKGDNSEDSDAQLIVVKAINDVNITPTVLSTTVSVQAPTVQVGINLTMTAISASVSLQAPTIEIKTGWANTNKSSTPSWTNEDKSML